MPNPPRLRRANWRRTAWRLLLSMLVQGALLGALWGFWQVRAQAPPPSPPLSQAQGRAVQAEPASLEALDVLAAGDLRGEIKPCGCSPEGQMGGLPRRLAYLAQVLSGPAPRPLLVDLGNNYPEPTDQGREKIALIRDLLARFTPDAVLPGPGELALGEAALSNALPYVLSNRAAPDDGTGAIAARRVVRRGALRIGIFGFLSPDEIYQGDQQRLRLRRVDADWLAGLRPRLAGLAAAVLLFRGSDEELAGLVRSGLFDRIVAGNPSADEMNQITERAAAGARIAQVPTKGQGVLRLPLRSRDAAGAAAAATPFVVDWLTERWADHPAAAPVFAAYDERVKALFFARLETQQRQAQQSQFVGAAACQACHAAQQAVWAQSRHARALATLQRVGKQYDPECLACHVVGLERGGFLSADLTPQLANVQCENCHGPAKAHLADPTRPPGPPPAADGALLARPAEVTCRTCHVGSHSPTFAFADYWPKVAHPAPGATAARTATSAATR